MSREFRDLKTLAEAREVLWDALPEAMREGRFGARSVPLAEAVGSVLHEAGYAVRAQDTFGASEGFPAYLKVTGEVRMGEPAGLSIGSQECARIPTGGMLPEGADAVLMVEHTQPWGADSIEALRPAAPGDHVVRRGDDVKQGATVLPAGHRLRPQDISALAGLGMSQVVVRRPRVGVLSTGDELVAHDAPLPPGKIRDMNGPALCAAVRALGAEPHDLGIVGDDREALQSALVVGLAESDLVLVSGGTSVGAHDLIPELLNSLGPPGVLVHGMAMRPGKPVVVAVVGERPAFGLPGHPTSALIIFHELVAPLIARATGAEAQRATVRARLSRNIPSQVGREDIIRVRLEQDDSGWRAVPVFAPSALITSLVQADGLVRIPVEAEGLYADENVEVELLS